MTQRKPRVRRSQTPRPKPTWPSPVEYTPKETSNKAISIRLELIMIRAAVEGVQLLCDLVRKHTAADRREAKQALMAASAAAELCAARLRLVDRVLGSRGDAYLLHTAFNETSATVGLVDDVLIPIPPTPYPTRAK